MHQPISNNTCPNCKEDSPEKVGWGYWYCHGCGNMWQIGMRNPVVIPHKESKKKPQFEQSDVPEPGNLTELLDTEIDFPL